VGITEAYSKFRAHMEDLCDGQYVPTRNRFAQRIRQLVRDDVGLKCVGINILILLEISNWCSIVDVILKLFL
tara:strand:- start:96 stop:311 length:216 start_codon:yes stop_codon:yes gene_type:complete